MISLPRALQVCRSAVRALSMTSSAMPMSSRYFPLCWWCRCVVVIRWIASIRRRAARVRSQNRHARPTSRTRNSQRPRFPRLGSEANGGIGSAEPLVVAALDDLEEKPLIERMRVDLEEFALAFAVVQNLVVAKGCHRCRIEIVFGLDIVVIIVRDFEEICAAGAHVGNRRENIGARKGNVLDAGAEEFVNEASRKRSRGR